MARVKLTPQERTRMIGVLEKAAGVPVSQFNTFAANWTQNFRFENSYDDVRTSRKPKSRNRREDRKRRDSIYEANGYDLLENGDEPKIYEKEYEPEQEEDEDLDEMQYIADESQNADDDDDGSEEESVDQESSRNPGPKQRDQRWPLTGEVLEVISTIQNTDDPQLKEWAYLLAHESLRYWFIRMAKKYGYARNQEARQDFFSAAEEVFAAGLPKYRADKGMLTTYFEPRIKKALGEEQRKHSCKNSTRHYESQWQTIEKCKALLAQQGIIDPNPRQISAYASLELKIDNISEQAIINCLEQARTQVAMDENIGYNISEDMENPETQYLQKEKIARLYKVIEKMPPLQKLLLTLRLQAIRETDKDMTTNELVRAAQKHIPGITLNEVRRANSAASLAVEKAFTNGYYHEKVILNGVTVSTENLEADAKEICEIVDTIDDFFEPM